MYVCILVTLATHERVQTDYPSYMRGIAVLIECAWRRHSCSRRTHALCSCSLHHPFLIPGQVYDIWFFCLVNQHGRWFLAELWRLFSSTGTTEAFLTPRSIIMILCTHENKTSLIIFSIITENVLKIPSTNKRLYYNWYWPPVKDRNPNLSFSSTMSDKWPAILHDTILILDRLLLIPLQVQFSSLNL